MNESGHVRMTYGEVLAAVLAGGMRQVSALARHRQGAHDPPADPPDWQWSIEGTLGEYATAILLDRCWRITHELDYGGDVGKLHVRATRHRDGHLIVYKSDPDDGPFILVCERGFDMWVMGWMRAEDAKQDRYWRTPPAVRSASYWVPAADLHPMSALPGVVR